MSACSDSSSHSQRSQRSQNTQDNKQIEAQTKQAKTRVQASLNEPKYIIFTSTYFLAELIKWSLTAEQDWQITPIFSAEQDPALAIPNDETIVRLQEATAIILNGAQFEKGLFGIDLPRQLTIQSAQDFKSSWLRYPANTIVEHQHGQGPSHSHTGIDGHTWMSPQRLKLQYQAIVQRLVGLKLEIEPTQKQAVLEQIAKLNQRWLTIAKLIQQKQVCIVANHPAYQYLAQDYQFSLKHFNLDPELSKTQIQEEISSEVLKDLAQRCKHSKAKMLWWEATPSSELVTHLQDLRYTHLTLRPLEQAPISSKKEVTLFSAIHSDLDRLEQALSALK